MQSILERLPGNFLTHLLFIKLPETHSEIKKQKHLCLYCPQGISWCYNFFQIKYLCKFASFSNISGVALQTQAPSSLGKGTFHTQYNLQACCQPGTTSFAGGPQSLESGPHLALPYGTKVQEFSCRSGVWHRAFCCFVIINRQSEQELKVRSSLFSEF